MSFPSKSTLVLLALCVAGTACLTSCGKKEMAAAAGMPAREVPARAVPALDSDVPLEVSAVGNVEAIASVDIKSRVAGQVLSVNFQEGQDVRPGQLLFEIDPEPLQRQIAELEANIAKDVALEQQARANVTRDEAQLKQARASSDRGLALAKDGIFSKEQTEQVVATADASQASLEADRAAIESAAASEKADRARLAQTNLQLGYTKITSPMAGRAGVINIKAGNLIKDNDAALVTILQTSPIYVSFGVPEQLLAEVRKYNAGHPLQVEAKISDQDTETGTLRFIDSSVDATTGTIKLKASFNNPKRNLWPGQFVNVQARLNLERGRILIPSRAIQTGPQGKYVWVMNVSDNTVSMRPVNVERLYQSPKSGEQAVIGSGLRSGEMVISEGQMRLMPGAKVRLLQSDTQGGGAGTAGPAGNS